MNRFKKVLAGVALSSALSSPIWAADLKIAVATEPRSLHPLAQALNSNHELAKHVFNSLIEPDEKFGPTPGLAESWTPTDDPLIWEFKLRKGVKFHNGTPFTAKDVAFTYELVPNVPNSPSTYKRRTKKIDKVVVVDDHTVHIHTKTPYPLLPRSLSAVPIVSHTVGLETDPSEFNNGRMLYGTGPYKFVEFVAGDHITYTANKGYWGGPPKWDNVTIRWITSGPARVAALLSGDVDMIASVPTTDVDNLDENPDINVSCDQTARIMYWSLDVSREYADHITAKDGSTIKNPLRDLRVRQAFNIAIDRDAIVEEVMTGLAVPANQITGEGFGGHNPDIPMPEHDIGKAKALMAEAGYGDGFKLTIHATNDRYINDDKQAQAIGQMLSRIGVDVEVVTQPVSGYYGKLRKHEMTMALIGWAAMTGEASSVIGPALRKGVRNNYGRWENPEFNRLIEGALGTVDMEKYDRLLKESVAVAMADVPIIPTHYQVACWASRKGLEFTPRADESTLAEYVN